MSSNPPTDWDVPDSIKQLAHEGEVKRLQGMAAELRDAVREQTSVLQRTPSKARLIGSGSDPRQFGTADGRWITAVLDASSRDAEAQARGKAVLEEYGSRREVGESKATLGTTDGNGGYLIPSMVANTVEIATAINPLRGLLNTVRVRNASAVEIPLGGVGPTRAEVVGRGETKPNVDVSLANYSSTLYTIARIYDVANQLLRQSAGAAEQLIVSYGTRAIAQGEAHYIINGAGTTEPMGLVTALDAAPASFTTTHTAADNTVAGSVRAAIVKAIKALALRNYGATAVLLNPGDAAQAMLQGADTAGFWDKEVGDPFGLRVVTTTAVPVQHAIVGDFSAATLYVGEDMRVDRSDEAGDRWDKNLTGFRFEEEFGFNAEPYVLSGAFQLIEGLTA